MCLLQYPFPINGDDMSWMTVYESKVEFLLNVDNPEYGLSSMAYPWSVPKGLTFPIDVSMIEEIDLAEMHIKVNLI